MKLFFIFITIFGYISAANVTKTVRLNSGYVCPVVGLGTGGHTTGIPNNTVVIQMVKDAIQIGYRHIDTARSYMNEEGIGQAFSQLISEGKVKREELFLTTKIFGSRDNSTRTRVGTLNDVHQGLRNLNLSYIDLMLIHRPSQDNDLNIEEWKGLEDAVDKGLVKSIGVSNFNVTQLESFIKSVKVMPAMNQIPSHPQLNQRQLIEFCAKHDIHLTAYSPLGAGKLFTDPTITAIGKKHNKTSAQVMIRWQIQRGIVAIPKSTRKDRLTENFNVFDFSLTNDEMKVLEDMK